MNNYLEAPNERTPEHNLLSIFLAGGISNCPDWQTLQAELLMKATNFLVINPRRYDFDTSKHDISIQQIIWEHQYLKAATCIQFWFPKETLCPITLFEFGYWLAQSQLSGKKIFVGCDPGYERLLDVQVQAHLVDPNLKIHSNLGDLYQEIVTYHDTIMAAAASIE